MRLTMAAFLYDSEKSRLPLSTARAVAKVGEVVCGGEIPLDNQLERVLAENALGLSGDEAAGLFLDAWLNRFVKAKRASTASRYPRSPNEAGDTSALLMMLRLCYDYGRHDDAKKLVSRYGSRMGSRHETIALLAEAAAIDEAASIARRNWLQLPLNTLGNSPVKFNATLKQKLQELLGELSDPAAAYVVEVAVARLPNEAGADVESLGTPRLSADRDGGPVR